MSFIQWRAGSIFFVVIASAVAGLVFGSEIVRLVMAGVLVLGAVPLWRAIRHFFRGQFWKDVEDVIVASDAPLSEEPLSVQEKDSPTVSVHWK